MVVFKHSRLILILLGVLTSEARASFLDPSAFPDPNAILTPSLVNASVKALGLATDHRPYEPATPLGTSLGADLSIDITLAKLPQEFYTELSAAGASSTQELPFLPVPRINVHKGLGPKFDLGISAILYRGYRIIGVEGKVAVWVPEEGPNWAIRLSYTNCYLKIVDGTTVELNTKTFTPQILISRPLAFADPYLGIGYQIATGKVTLTIPLDPLPPQTSSQNGQGSGFLAFLGVGLRIPNTGLKLTLEGAYSTAGALTLGTKFGFSF